MSQPAVPASRISRRAGARSHIRRAVLLVPVLYLALVLPGVPCECLGSSGHLTLWITPAEPAVGGLDSQGDSPAFVWRDVEEFNLRHGEANHVTVLNTTAPSLRDHLLNRSMEAGEPNWPMIKGQERCLTAIEQFAESTQIHVDIRFLSWEGMWKELGVHAQRGGTGGARSLERPDIAQIGSSWVPWMAESGMLAPLQAGDSLKFRVDQREMRVSIRYTRDIRLLYFRPETHLDRTARSPSPPSWQTIVDTLRSAAMSSDAPEFRSLVMPIGLTLNLLHDYVPLVWAGGGEFLRIRGPRAVLTSSEALEVPALLMSHATVGVSSDLPVRVISFPEVGHEEAARRFLAGEFGAILEPPYFLSRWHEHEASRLRQSMGDTATPESVESRFRRLGRVMAPPCPFIGGSDLAIMSPASSVDDGMELARYLARDPRCLRVLLDVGHVPAQLTPEELETEFSRRFPYSTEFSSALRVAVETGREYPAIPQWATEVESSETLDALQRVFRAVARGNDGPEALAALTRQASEAEWNLNRRINPFYRLAFRLRPYAPVLGAAVLLGLALMILALKTTLDEQRRRNLVLSLYADRLHTLSHPFLAIDSLTAASDPAALANVQAHTKFVRGSFFPLLEKITGRLRAEMQTQSDPRSLAVITRQAFRLARIERRAMFPDRPCSLSLRCDPGLRAYRLSVYPTVLLVILREWFLNSMKAYEGDDAPTFQVWVEERRPSPALAIRTPTPLDSASRAFLSAPEVGPPTRGGQGLPLIRKMLWYAFKTRAVLDPSKTETIVYLSLPLRRTRP